MKKSDAA